MQLLGDTAYDWEVFPNFSCVGFQEVSGSPDIGWVFEISDRRNESAGLYDFIQRVKRLVGFNNETYDYPILHEFLSQFATYGICTPHALWMKNQKLFETSFNEKWRNRIWKPLIPQVDLMGIIHGDRFGVSLKQCEFTMRSELVYDLPIEPGTIVTPEQMDTLISYNAYDVKQTVKMAKALKGDIEFREKIDPTWVSFNDGKIGKKYFEQQLIAAGVQIYTGETGADGRRIRKSTARTEGVRLGDVVLPFIGFTRPENVQKLAFIKDQLILPGKTKGGFKDCINLNGFEIDIGLGGIHGSIKRQFIRSNGGRIKDIDGFSYYPSIAIEHGIYPAHLGSEFCRVYRELRDRRAILSKSDPARTTLKYALNVPFGDSNSRHGIFYDPAYMLAITVNGQLLLCVLAEQFANAGIKIVQVNTDGVTVFVRPEQEQFCDRIVKWWSQYSRIKIEETLYERMYIKDSNNYLAVKTDGERKRVGDYDYEKIRLGKYWQSNHSMPIVAKAAEVAFFNGTPPLSYIPIHENPWDFLLFRKGNLTVDGAQVPKNFRYYVSHHGGKMVQKHPAGLVGVHAEGLASCVGDRKTGYACSECGNRFRTKKEFEDHNKADHSWKVAPALSFSGRLPDDVDFRFYIRETEKLVDLEQWN